jgi:transposase InsO family protein
MLRHACGYALADKNTDFRVMQDHLGHKPAPHPPTTPAPAPSGQNERWSLDFVSDSFTDGRRFRVLAVVDDFTRESSALIPDTSLSGARVAREIDALLSRRRHRADEHGDAAMDADARRRLALHRARLD